MMVNFMLNIFHHNENFFLCRKEKFLFIFFDSLKISLIIVIQEICYYDESFKNDFEILRIPSKVSQISFFIVAFIICDYQPFLPVITVYKVRRILKTKTNKKKNRALKSIKEDFYTGLIINAIVGDQVMTSYLKLQVTSLWDNFPYWNFVSHFLSSSISLPETSFS